MKKAFFISLLGLVFTEAISQDLKSLGGSNTWIFHTPTDGRTSLYIAPGTSQDWRWNSQTEFMSNGDIITAGKITVKGDGSTKAITSMGGIALRGSNSVNNALRFNDIEGKDRHFIYVDHKNDVRLGNQNFNLIKFQDQNISVLNGKLGIGTTDFSGTHKLRVDGSIGARRVKVEAKTWSDFVFEKEYELRTLEEVENHINDNGHLPEIPNETEVQKNGIDLGAMDAKLLQKIEELTLYMIDMNKQMQRLDLENKKLKEKVVNLENK